MRSKVAYCNGLQCFQVDDKIIDSLAFKSFRPTWKNVQQFYKAGIRIFHVYCSGLPSGLKVPYSLFGETWFGDKQYDFTNLDKQIDFFKENAPDGYVFINIHLDSRQWWLDENPGNPNSFTHLSQIASNDKWKKDTADYLKALIKHTEEKYNNYVIGYFLLGGYTTEWFSEFDHEETNSYKEKKWQEYRKDKNAKIPTKEKLEKPNNQVFLSKENDNDVIDYRIFHNNLVADTVLYFAHAAQEVLNHTKIVGLFFGYILELLYKRLWEAGHIEFDKINRSKDIDLLATPASYQFRGFEDSGAFMLLCDTLAKNKKGCFISFDHSTYLLPTLADNKERVCGDPDTDVALKLLAQMRSGNPKDLLKTKEETIQTMRREFMQRMCKRLGMWWFDMFEGWFYDKDLMNEIQHQVEISKDLMPLEKKSISEVAVFISGESLYYVNKMSGMNTELICNQRGGLARMGTPYDIFSLNDLDYDDCQKYKALIFIGAFALTEKQKQTIEELKANNRTLVFIGAPDCVNKNQNSILGMELDQVKGLESTIECENYSYGYEQEKTDAMFVKDTNVKVLGKYKNSSKSALVLKKNADYSIVFSGIGNLSADALRDILKEANVHVYLENNEATFISNKLIGIYCPLHKESTIMLQKDGKYIDLFTNEVFISNNKKININTSVNCARLLLEK